MEESNNASLNVVESSSMGGDPSGGLKEGVVASDLIKVEPKMTVRKELPAVESGLTNPLQKDVLLLTSVVSTVDTFGVVDQYVPGVLWFANSFVLNRLTGSWGYTGSMVVTIQFSFPPGAFGSYVVFAIPDGYNYTAFSANCIEHDGSSMDSPITARQCLHAMIDAATSTSCQLVLPWVSDRDWQPISGESNFSNWRLVVACVAPLQLNAGGAGTANYTIYIRGGPDFHLVTPAYQAGKLSEVASGVAGFASSLAKFPTFEPIAAPVAFVAGVASRLLSAFGFTRHTDVAAPIHVKQTASSNIVNTDGNETGTVLALTGANTLSLEAYGGADAFDNMSFKHLFCKPTIVQQFSWSTTAATGVKLANVGVSPFWCYNPTSLGWHFPVAGYVGLPFSNWRGDMCYEVVISSSALMRGTMQIYWALNAGDPTVDPTNTAYNIVCDVESNKSCKFSVGYASDRPMLDSVPLYDFSTNAISFPNCLNGHLGFRVVNPLMNMSGAATVVVTVYAWADADMQFSVPRDYISNMGINVPTDCHPFATALNYQSGVLGNDDREVSIEVLVPRAPHLNVSDILVGEAIGSVRPLLQKFSRYFYSDATYVPYVVSLGFSIYVDHFGQLNHNGVPESLFPFQATTFASFNWLRHYAAMYEGISGSTRYKVFATTLAASGQPMIFVTPEVLRPPAGFSVVEPTVALLNDFTVVEPTDNCRATEFTVPYYNDAYSVPCRFAQVNDTKAHIMLNAAQLRVDRLTIRDCTVQAVVGSSTNFSLYTAGGPDTKFTVFRRVPVLNYNPGVAPTGIISWTVQ